MLTRRATLSLLAVTTILATTGCTAHRTSTVAPVATAPTIVADTAAPKLGIVPIVIGRPAPIIIADSVRESLPNDYLRVLFIPPGKSPNPVVPVVTMLGRPYNLRAFATATPLYEPPLTVHQFPYFSGLEDQPQNYLVALRCRPSQPAKVDAILATWPNVFQAIPRDINLNPGNCGQPGPVDPSTETACYAAKFTAEDKPSASVPLALGKVFAYAAVLFDPQHAALADWLKGAYGIYPAFAGSGYSVKDSYTLDAQPMSTNAILVKSVSSEYLLKNVSLADAGCSCITVPPYTGRSDDRLDPDFIAQKGGNGSCNVVTKLDVVQH